MWTIVDCVKSERKDLDCGHHFDKPYAKACSRLWTQRNCCKIRESPSANSETLVDKDIKPLWPFLCVEQSNVLPQLVISSTFDTTAVYTSVSISLASCCIVYHSQLSPQRMSFTISKVHLGQKGLWSRLQWSDASPPQGSVEVMLTMLARFSLQAVSSVETQPNIRLSLVVDTSSSVEGPKLEVIKESGRYLAKKLAASEGVLSVTTFNETVCKQHAYTFLILFIGSKSICSRVVFIKHSCLWCCGIGNHLSRFQA